MADMKKINTKKAFKISIIAYAAVILIGLIFTFVFGLKLDINFAGGTRITYSYTGDVKEKDFEDYINSKDKLEILKIVLIQEGVEIISHSLGQIVIFLTFSIKECWP